eukprot:NODE_297_length_1034_cov_79.485279_g254_i0.p1 GENE.NODE_297_length_1034_cov_79.485279_g254_i0~~NODE_297_length_1034_cov_79.485279_g254_i0.p1  ORF type:complete len:159 (+),score=56.29 NODE_297_length_1034_cov_79.485279_g254_i0:172-648(+)
MQFSAIALFAAGAMAAEWAGNNTMAYTTQVVTSYTTYCPAPTSIVHGDKTWVVTKATTLTITDCPCTLTKPVTSSKASSTSSAKKSTSEEWKWESSKPATVTYAKETPAVWTSTATWATVTPKVNATSTKPVQFTGAAVANGAAAGLVGVAALFAAAL